MQTGLFSGALCLDRTVVTDETPPDKGEYSPLRPLLPTFLLANVQSLDSTLCAGALQGTTALFASQKPRCLQWFQTQPSSLQGSPCIARTERKNSLEKAEVGASVSLSTSRGVMKGTYTLLNPSDPLIWNLIYFCVDHSGYQGNLQRS